MPPKKEAKEKQVKGDEAEELILQYLRSVNRPYASTDVSANLKNAVPKAAAQKVLQTLSDRGDLTVKQYNKQTIFVYNQDNLPVPSPDELAELDGAHKATSDEVKERKEDLRGLEKGTAALPKTKDLPAEVERIAKENALTVTALAPYRKTDSGEAPVQPLTAEEIKVIDMEFVKWHKEWKARQRIYKELQGFALELTAQKADDFMEDQGICPDDEAALAGLDDEFTKPPARPVLSKKSANIASSKVIKSSAPFISTSIPSKPSKASTPAIATVTVTSKPPSTAAAKSKTAVNSKKRTHTASSNAGKVKASSQDDDALEASVEDEDKSDSERTLVPSQDQDSTSQVTAVSQEASDSSGDASSESYEEPPKKRGRRG